MLGLDEAIWWVEHYQKGLKAPAQASSSEAENWADEEYPPVAESVEGPFETIAIPSKPRK